MWDRGCRRRDVRKKESVSVAGFLVLVIARQMSFVYTLLPLYDKIQSHSFPRHLKNTSV